MKVTFYSNFLTHHQLPFCLEMQKRLGEDFKFVSTVKIFKWRLDMGFQDLDQKYDFVVRELATEKVRKEFYPDYPSRLHCMYLSLSRQTALKNFEKSKEPHLQAIAVKLNGKIHKCGNVMLDRNGGSFEDYEKTAHEYWKQENVKDEDVKEILFEGKAEIVEIMDER